MPFIDDFIHTIGDALELIAKQFKGYRRMKGIWVDVGAHKGEKTLAFARRDPLLTVFAFEPNLQLARRLMGILPNYVVFPFAISESDGIAEFFLNECSPASSLLPFDENGLNLWIGKESISRVTKTQVPTLRLDSFMVLMSIQKVDFLKIDAQGADFVVLKSAGDRIRDVESILLEVQTTTSPLYSGSSSKTEIIQYLEKYGFRLVGCESQSEGQEENLHFENGFLKS